MNPRGRLYPWAILLLATGTQTALSTVGAAMGALAPFVKADLQLSHTQMGVLGPAVIVGMVFTAIPLGRATDLWGEGRVLSAGALMVGLATALTWSAHSFLPLLAILIFTGLWAASGTTAGSRLVTGWFPYRQWGLALGVRQTGIPLGGLLAAGLLPVLAARAGWRAAFMVAGAICVATGIAVYLAYREPERPRAAVSGGATWRILAELIRNGSLWRVTVAAAALAGAQFGMAAHLVLYLTSDVGWSISMAALGLVAANSMGVVGRVVWAVATDTIFLRHRQWGMAAPGLIAVVAATVLAFLPPHIPVPWVLATAALLGFGVLGWVAAQIAMVIELVTPDRRATAVGMSMAVQQAGVVIVPTSMGVLADLSGSYRFSWLFLALAVAAALTLLRGVHLAAAPAPDATS